MPYSIRLEFENATLAEETAEALSNAGFTVEFATDGQIITLIAVKL